MFLPFRHAPGTISLSIYTTRLVHSIASSPSLVSHHCCSHVRPRRVPQAPNMHLEYAERGRALHSHCACGDGARFNEAFSVSGHYALLLGASRGRTQYVILSALRCRGAGGWSLGCSGCCFLRVHSSHGCGCALNNCTGVDDYLDWDCELVRPPIVEKLLKTDVKIDIGSENYRDAVKVLSVGAGGACDKQPPPGEHSRLSFSYVADDPFDLAKKFQELHALPLTTVPVIANHIRRVAGLKEGELKFPVPLPLGRSRPSSPHVPCVRTPQRPR